MTRENWLAVIVPSVLAVLTGLFFPEFRDWLAGPAKPEPSVSDVVIGTHARSGQPRVEFALHNNGDRTSVLQSVSFAVRAVAVFNTCATAGDLSIAKSYGVKLPIRAKVGQVIAAGPLRRQLRPDEAERLAFRFGLSGARPGEGAAFALTAELKHDDAEDPAPLGEIVIAVGGGDGPQVFERTHREEVDPNQPGEELVRDDGFIRGLSLGVPAIRCLRDNTVALNRVVAQDGKQSPALSRIGRWLMSPEEANAFASKYGVR